MDQTPIKMEDLLALDAKSVPTRRTRNFNVTIMISYNGNELGKL